MMTANKSIWIINQYASTPETGMGGRHYYLGQELAKLGYKVYVIAAGFHHLLRTPLEFEGKFSCEQRDENFTFVRVKMPSYESAHSKQRIVNWFLFAWRIRQLKKIIPEKPDAIICSSPSPVAFLGAQHLAKKLNSKLLFEVRDIWPLSLVEIGGFSEQHPFIRFLQWIEDKAYRDADQVISNLRYSVDHMQQRGMAEAKFSWVPNGFSLSEVELATPLNEAARNALPQNKFIVGYTGTLGAANALDVLLASAESLKDYDDIAFVLVGNGKEKEKLQQIVTNKQLSNVTFIDAIPKAEIQSMLSHFDACYIGLTKDPLFRFGVSPNKLFDYLYSAKPIIYAIDSGKYRPVEEINAGFHVAPGDVVAITEAVLKLYKMTETQKNELGKNGQHIAIEQYEYSKLAEQLARVVFS